MPPRSGTNRGWPAVGPISTLRSRTLVESPLIPPIKFLELLNGQVQHVVPRWQRRYCWGQPDIERLVDGLVPITAADPSATHHGGTLLTFPDPGAAGVVTTIRVVDGQQRLTTVSILLGCIAAKHRRGG